MSTRLEVQAFLDKLAETHRLLDDAAEARTGDGSPEAIQARRAFVVAAGEMGQLQAKLAHSAVMWLGILVQDLAIAESRAAGGLLSGPPMIYGHHEEVLVQLIREQSALIDHLVTSAERRRWLARPNGTQLIAHQRARSLEEMLGHMGLKHGGQSADT